MKAVNEEWGRELCKIRHRAKRYLSPFQERMERNSELLPWFSWSVLKIISCIFLTKTRCMPIHVHVHVPVHECATYWFSYFGRLSRLTWHNWMPQQEIWVKLGGDKGGSCMKVHAQLCNVPNPNSPKNTSVFTAFEAPDTMANLHIALTCYQDQVIKLQSLKSR